MVHKPTLEVESDNSFEIVEELGELSPGTVIDKKALAKIFNRCTTSVDRAIERGELPAPVKILGKPRWTVKSILDYIGDRLRTAQEEAEKEKLRLARISP